MLPKKLGVKEKRQCDLCNSFDGKPKRLKCGHIICRRCLQSMLEENWNEKVKCTVCRKQLFTVKDKTESADSDVFTVTDTVQPMDRKHCALCNSLNGKPKKLKCGHIICRRCLQSMLEVNFNEKVKCTVCRKQPSTVKDKTESADSDVFMETDTGKLMDGKTMKGVHSNVTYICQICAKEEQVAYTFCMDCKVHMCRPCSEQHKQRATFINHQLIKTSQSICKRHEQQYTHVCGECNTFLCIACINNGLCDNHPIEVITVVAGETRNELDQLITIMTGDLDNKKKTIYPSMALVESKIRQTRTIKNEIDEHAQVCISKIQKRRKELLGELVQWQSEIVDSQNDSEPNKELLEELLETAVTVKQCADVEVLLAVPAIKSKFGTLCKTGTAHGKDQGLQFNKTDSLELGSLTTMNGEQVRPKRKPEPKLLWQTEDGMAQSYVTAVVFTKGNSIVICDNGQKCLKLYDFNGQLICSSLDKGVVFNDNICGVTYHSTEHTVIVAAGAEGIIFLDENNLSEKKRLLSLGPHCYGIALLHDDKYVVSTVYNNLANETISDIVIYHKSGKVLRKIHRVRLSNMKFSNVGQHHYVTVLSDNVIAVCSPLFNEVIFLDSKGKQIGVKNLVHSNLSQPKGLCKDSTGNALLICVVGENPSAIYRVKLWKKPEVIIHNFNHPLYVKNGPVFAMTVMDCYLVVVLQTCIQLYEYDK